MSDPVWLAHIPESYRDLVRELAEALAPDIVLEGVLGVGGMGAVLVGREAALDRNVAVKLLSPSLAGDAVAHARFLREAQAAAAVQHANVVPIFRVGELPVSGTPYFVMQHVSGRTLEAAFPAGTPAPVVDVHRIVGQVASALAAAHAKGLVHRDIKPANVLFDDTGRRVMVVDFGISASRAALPTDQRLTLQGQTLGTPQYMSPEVAAGEPAGPASDIYSLGCVAYELLSGRPVFSASTPQGVIARHIRDIPEPLAGLRKDISADLTELVGRCLDKNPEARPTAESIAHTLLPAELPFEWPPPGMRRVQGWLARVAPWFAVATLLFGTPLLVAIGVGMDAVLMESPRTLVIGLLLLLPVVVFMLATSIAIGKLFEVLRVGRDGGLSSLTVLEVLADPGDTAQLVAGLREYATFTPARRLRLRKLRIVRPLFLLAAAPLTVLALPIGWLVLPRFGGAVTGFAWIGVAAFCVPVAVSIVLGLAQGGRALRLTVRRDRLIDRLPSETRRWRVHAELVTAEDPLLLGRPAPVGMFLLSGVGLGAMLLSGVFVLIYLAITLALSSISQVEHASYYIDRLAEQSQWGIVPAHLRAPTDASIGEEAAGRMAYRLFMRPSGSLRRYLPPVDTLPSYAMFAEDTLRNVFALSGASIDLWERIIVRVTTSGITAKQRAYLARGAAHPTSATLTRLAHAPSMDLYAAVLGSPARVSWALFAWNPTRGVRNAVQPHFAKAALLAADGRIEEAAAAVREVISVGALLMEDGRRQVDFRAGAECVRRGTLVLRMLLARSPAGVDVTVPGERLTAAGWLRASPAEVAAPDTRQALMTMRSVVVEQRFLAHRFAALSALRILHCRSPVRALFPESPEDEKSFRLVEGSLRRASDRALFAWARDTLGRPTWARSPTRPAWAASPTPGDTGTRPDRYDPVDPARTIGRALAFLGWSPAGGACATISNIGTFW